MITELLLRLLFSSTREGDCYPLFYSTAGIGHITRDVAGRSVVDQHRHRCER